MGANTVLLIRPANFGFNAETEVSNAFQNKLAESKEIIMEKALVEFDTFAAKLRSKGVTVVVYDDTSNPEKPDAIFPNNWISMHEDGKIILYPMLAENRRHERREDIIKGLSEKFVVTDVLDLSQYEEKGMFLEGTGSIVFDHENRIAYACISPRTNRELLLQVCDYLDYKPVFFAAHDRKGKEIYHTNVMMCIGEGFAVVCSDSMAERDNEIVTGSLSKFGYDIIGISLEQMENFAGNMLALNTDGGENILVLSQSSFDILTREQRGQLSKYCELVPMSINTIETIGGGSARCMIGEVFLKKR